MVLRARPGGYARGRPDYPQELLPWLHDCLRLGPDRQAIDLGAGTGKFTTLLLRTGAHVTAVEPVEAMRAELAHALPGVITLAGSAQAIPAAVSSADALVCAQAFHWFATRPALREIHRVLKPGGRLGLVWNVRDDTVDWVAAIARLVNAYEGDTPRQASGEWRQVFTGDLFTAPVESVFSYQHRGSPEQVIIDRVFSTSFIAALPAAEQATLLQRLRDLIATHPQLRGRAVVDYPYRTHAWWCLRREF